MSFSLAVLSPRGSPAAGKKRLLEGQVHKTGSQFAFKHNGRGGSTFKRQGFAAFKEGFFLSHVLFFWCSSRKASMLHSPVLFWIIYQKQIDLTHSSLASCNSTTWEGGAAVTPCFLQVDTGSDPIGFYSNLNAGTKKTSRKRPLSSFRDHYVDFEPCQAHLSRARELARVPVSHSTEGNRLGMYDPASKY